MSMNAPSETAPKMPVGEPPKLNRAETFEEKLYRKVLENIALFFSSRHTLTRSVSFFLKLAVL